MARRWERTAHQTKLTRASRRGQEIEESCGDGERKCHIVVPLIVGLVPIGVNPLAAVVAVRVEHIRVAVGMYEVPSVSPSLEASCDLRIVCGVSAVFGIIMPEHSTPSIFIFLKCLRMSSTCNRDRRCSQHTDTGFGSGKPKITLVVARVCTYYRI